MNITPSRRYRATVIPKDVDLEDAAVPADPVAHRRAAKEGEPDSLHELG